VDTGSANLAVAGKAHPDIDTWFNPQLWVILIPSLSTQIWLSSHFISFTFWFHLCQFQFIQVILLLHYCSMRVRPL